MYFYFWLSHFADNTFAFYLSIILNVGLLLEMKNYSVVLLCLFK